MRVLYLFLVKVVFGDFACRVSIYVYMDLYGLIVSNCVLVSVRFNTVNF
jgi:hypothetical protein